MTNKKDTGHTDAANLAAAGHGGTAGKDAGSDAGKSAADTAKEQGGTSHADNLKDAGKDKAPASDALKTGTDAEKIAAAAAAGKEHQRVGHGDVGNVADVLGKQQSSDPGADADAARLRQAEEDAANRNRGAGKDPTDPVEQELDPLRKPLSDEPAQVKVNDPASAEGKIAQIANVRDENERRNEANLEGHEKNMQRIADDAERGHEAYRKEPPTGMQRDENTPTILPDGRKVWK